MPPTSVLVTGATGFAGSHLIDLLASSEVTISAWHRPNGAPTTRAPGVRWQPVDLRDRQAVASALAEVRPDHVYHCAGASHVGESWRTATATFVTNVQGTHHLVECIRTLGLKTRLLVPSSALVYTTQTAPLREDSPIGPSSPYGVSKLAQELVAADDPQALHVSIARAFNHIGPRQSPAFVASAFARRIAVIEAGGAPRELRVGNLDARRDLTDVRDTVRAYRLIVEQGRPGRVYNVCSGEAISVRDLLDMLLARARVPIAVTVDPALYRPNDNPIVVGDSSRLREETGWQPSIPIERTLDDLLEYWRQQTPTTSGTL